MVMGAVSKTVGGRKSMGIDTSSYREAPLASCAHNVVSYGGRREYAGTFPTPSYEDKLKTAPGR